MNAPKHTPGPWRLEADPCHFDSLTTITGGQRMNAKPHAWPAYPLNVQVGGTCKLQEMQANARLIAAAPELLEALQRIIAAANTSTNDAATLNWIADTASAAIAKATAQQ